MEAIDLSGGGAGEENEAVSLRFSLRTGEVGREESIGESLFTFFASLA